MSAWGGRLEPDTKAALVRSVRASATLAAEELSDAVREKLTKNPTGSIARSFEVDVVDSYPPSATVVSRLSYAQIQDQGGSIVPKRAKMLAIPVPGVPRGVRPREYPGILHVEGSRKSRDLRLVDAEGKTRFLLRRRVVIIGTRYVDVAQKQLETSLPDIVASEISKA
jgi:Family of unknown function (DUF6441)